MEPTDFWCGSLLITMKDIRHIWVVSFAGILDLVNLTYGKSVIDGLKLRVIQGYGV